ncbi:MAG: hypothetical protein DI535_03675 [Citrobacter freundii]|nr:MAG: hypothetical protein DI535_03675 [Citrobacter freundii]
MPVLFYLLASLSLFQDNYWSTALQQQLFNQDSGAIALSFSHQVGADSLVLGKQYVNPFGESFTVHKFKYYVSHIALHGGENDGTYISPEHFLINESVDSSKTIRLKVPTGNYAGISFLIGVDSIDNVSGAQTGTLDPINDMFWTWNTGYVMAKLEGTSAASTLPRRMFEYHIGGYDGKYNSLQRIFLAFKQKETFHITENTRSNINIVTDLNYWFTGTEDLKISDTPACTSAGPLAKRYAENYKEMFSLKSILAY